MPARFQPDAPDADASDPAWIEGKILIGRRSLRFGAKPVCTIPDRGSARDASRLTRASRTGPALLASELFYPLRSPLRLSEVHRRTDPRRRATVDTLKEHVIAIEVYRQGRDFNTAAIRSCASTRGGCADELHEYMRGLCTARFKSQCPRVVTRRFFSSTGSGNPAGNFSPAPADADRAAVLPHRSGQREKASWPRRDHARRTWS